jgi:hypothetical protein
MQPISEFRGCDRSFWAYVKLISEGLGYSLRTRRGQPKELRRYLPSEVASLLGERNISVGGLAASVPGGHGTLGDALCAYLNQRAETLEREVAPLLMERKEAEAHFTRLRRKLKPTCYLPMNKQKGEKRHHNFLTCIVNMLTQDALGGRAFADNPRSLVAVTCGGGLIRTLSRWMDGAYPDTTDPHAVWEMKEYYGTTTFGSRVADGVYETMLDGEELAELEANEGRRIRHYLMVDDRFTWWECGRAYLCRLVDILHMGLVDEVLFGREVLVRWPEIVSEWP